MNERWAQRPMTAKKRFNLNIEYSYRISAMLKITCHVILAGPVGTSDVASIKDRIEDGIYFVPGQVLLPDLRCAFDEEGRAWDKAVDQPWHELEKISLTKNVQTEWFDKTASEVVDAFIAVRWDDDYLSGPTKPLFVTQQVVSDGALNKSET